MDIFGWLIVATYLVMGIAGAGHALLSKKDSSTALGWIAVCLTFPLIGPMLYFLFGINRVQMRASEMERRALNPLPRLQDAGSSSGIPAKLADEFIQLARISGTVTGRLLYPGNAVDLLQNGEQAYPAMLEAIGSATGTVYLCSYIFESNNSGRQFIDALANAQARGVNVRVLLDGIGEWYSWPRASRMLRKRGVRVARFLPPKLLPPELHVNLRNHRKILVCDGKVAFTGGMNIGDRHLRDLPDSRHAVTDVHFRLRGPVVADIEHAFIRDWAFCSGERLDENQSSNEPTGNSFCRVITDGPNDDFGVLTRILEGAVSCADRSVTIMTPYFLPSQELIAALQSAALRGVEVRVVLPAHNNLRFVHWASRNRLADLLQWGVRIYYQPPPFAHSKLFVVDEGYAVVGSANIDPRSLRLNFELAVEVYDRTFVGEIALHLAAVCNQSRSVSLEEMKERSLPVRIRDALAWLFTPYL